MLKGGRGVAYHTVTMGGEPRLPVLTSPVLIAMIAPAVRFIKRVIDGDSLPAYVIFRHPPVVISYFEDFLSHRDAILRALAGSKPYLLFQFGWHRETAERIQEVRREAEETLRLCPQAELIFLCNSEHETGLISAAGLRGEFCHQNAFLDETRYRIHPGTPRYDAIYIARITPFKRHHLAAKIASLRLIGDHSAAEADYFAKVMAQLSHASWKRKVFSRFVSKAICEAHCGLCLSAEEGAMFVSAEYLLSGRPVVSTASLGGRDSLFGPDYTYRAEDTPESVLAGVEAMKRCPVGPAEIRARTIDKCVPHRERMIEILQDICDREGVDLDAAAQWPSYFTHKFGLRCFNGPGVRLTRILKRKP